MEINPQRIPPTPPHAPPTSPFADGPSMGWGGVGGVPYGCISMLDIGFWIPLSLSLYIFKYIYIERER